MALAQNYKNRFELTYRADAHRRMIGGVEVIVHCHHYNSRIQHIVESASAIDGKRIITEAAETVMAQQIANVLEAGDSADDKWQVACDLYAHLGFGMIDPSGRAVDVITAPQSHFVEGWTAGFRKADRCVCSFTEGYLQAAFAVVEGARVVVREVECAYRGADTCRFEVERVGTCAAPDLTKQTISFNARAREAESVSNVNEQAIVSAVVDMPIMGGEQGLIPAFGVYLANTPADFYNLVCLKFVEEMSRVGQADTARELLLFAGETCAMNTFRGIMHSPEWDALIAPMITEKRDELFALVALSNGFGWGNWYINEHDDSMSLAIRSLNGYEALGAMEFGSAHNEGQCYMLAGVSAGMMELIYSHGTMDERFGTFESSEHVCIASGHATCDFGVEPV